MNDNCRMPTFIVFENGRPVSTVRGADPRRLSEVVRKLATEATKTDDSATGESSSGGGGVWLGASIPKGYMDVTDQIDLKGLDLLNLDDQFGTARSLFDSSKPSSLINNKGKGKGKEEGGGSSPDWVESDTDEQMMLYVPFNSKIKIHSLHITSLPPSSDDDDDDAPMRPKTIRLYTNRPQVLGFDEAEDIPVVQAVEIKPGDWDSKTGTAKVDLRFVKFQNVTSLVVFFSDGDGTSDKLRLDRIRIFGEAGEKRDMGKLEKIGDEVGEWILKKKKKKKRKKKKERKKKEMLWYYYIQEESASLQKGAA